MPKAYENVRATIAEIDSVIRRRTGGEKSIRRVARPRQKLEEFFLQIVEKARASHVATSGAQAGGPTASFLLGDEAPKGGEELIERLTTEATSTATPSPIAQIVPSESKSAGGPDSDLIGSLTTAEPSTVRAEPSPIPNRVTPAAPAAPIDDDVISRLIDKPADSGPKRGGA